MPSIRAPYVRTEVETAIWAAFRDGVVTSILDGHGVIAKIVPRDQNNAGERVLTFNELQLLSDLMRGVQQHMRIRYYPRGSKSVDTPMTMVLRAFTNEDGSIYSGDADLRDAHVWCSGITEKFIPVSMLTKALDNLDGKHGDYEPIATMDDNTVRRTT